MAINDSDELQDFKRIPVVLLTGFLGAGKTTLLRRLITSAAFANAALVINEIGDIGIDQDLIRNHAGQPILLAGGCICCAMRQDLGYTLRDLHLRRSRGTVPAFDRVIIETSGLATPVPILQALINDGWLSQRFLPGGTFTLVDALNGSTNLDRHSEAVQQIALADKLILTKSDLADAGQIEKLTARLHTINAAAPLMIATNGMLNPDLLASPGLVPAVDTIENWLKISETDSTCAHGCGHSQTSNAATTVNLSIPWSRWAASLDRLTAKHRNRLLRLKGLLSVEGVETPVVIQCVRNSFHPPFLLEGPPLEADARSRLVLIAEGPDARSILEDLISDLTGFMHAKELVSERH